LNVLNTPNYLTQLQQAGLPAEDLKNIEFEVNSSRDVIPAANQIANQLYQTKMEQGNDNIQSIETDVRDLRNSLANRSQLLQQVISSKTTIIYKSNNLESTIQEALQYFEHQLSNLKNVLIAIKEKELITKYAVNVSAEGRPDEDLAKSAVDLSNQINQSYSKVEQFFKETEVVNNMLVSDNAERGMDVFRQLEQIWLYPVPGGDNYLLSVVAKFKISPQTMTSTVATIKDQSPPLQEDENNEGSLLFVAYDEPPEPIGGFAAIQTNLKYSEILRKTRVEGKVIVKVLINEKGYVVKTEILKSLGNNDGDAAAIEAIRKVRWKPAMQHNRPVKVWISIPVIFNLK
jgi:TonB family protein